MHVGCGRSTGKVRNGTVLRVGVTAFQGEASVRSSGLDSAGVPQIVSVTELDAERDVGGDNTESVAPCSASTEMYR